MTYTPDITRYQQLVYGGATAGVDCTAWGGALVTDAHTRGAIKLSGRAIRLASDEPKPDPASPGLNVDQVDAAIVKLTVGKVNLTTRRDWSRDAVRNLLTEGRWGNVSVLRSVLVDRGNAGGNYFRGRHDVTLHVRLTDGLPVIGDPLVHYYMVSGWDAVLDAMSAVDSTPNLYASFTRDLVPDYEASVNAGAFWRYLVRNGKIIGRESYRTGGFSGRCTPPKYVGGVYARQLVRMLTGSRGDETLGAGKGWWISATYADEV